MIRIVSWNIHGKSLTWHDVLELDADVALLQEAPAPPASLASRIDVESTAPWETAGGGVRRSWRATVVRLSDRVRLTGRPSVSVDHAERNQFCVSRAGSLAAGDVTVLETGEILTVASMYAAWERPEAKTGRIYADASAHRLISDLSTLIGNETGRRIIAAGDLNILFGYGEHGSTYWRSRYDTVFSRMEALGLRFVGPQAPDGGLQADPWPEELPRQSRNVPTFRWKLNLAETATRQLDFVFASTLLQERLSVRALNTAAEWGPSDHCHVIIQVGAAS
jgi:hypothetical protein